MAPDPTVHGSSNFYLAVITFVPILLIAYALQIRSFETLRHGKESLQAELNDAVTRAQQRRGLARAISRWNARIAYRQGQIFYSAAGFVAIGGGSTAIWASLAALYHERPTSVEASCATSGVCLLVLGFVAHGVATFFSNTEGSPKVQAALEDHGPSSNNIGLNPEEVRAAADSEATLPAELLCGGGLVVLVGGAWCLYRTRARSQGDAEVPSG